MIRQAPPSKLREAPWFGASRADRLFAMRTAVATIIAAAAISTVIGAVPAGAATPMPPPNDAALRAAISGLPSQEATGALVRITGSAGAWSGFAGVSDVRTGAPVRAGG